MTSRRWLVSWSDAELTDGWMAVFKGGGFVYFGSTFLTKHIPWNYIKINKIKRYCIRGDKLFSEYLWDHRYEILPVQSFKQSPSVSLYLGCFTFSLIALDICPLQFSVTRPITNPDTTIKCDLNKINHFQKYFISFPTEENNLLIKF